MYAAKIALPSGQNPNPETLVASQRSWIYDPEAGRVRLLGGTDKLGALAPVGADPYWLSKHLRECYGREAHVMNSWSLDENQDRLSKRCQTYRSQIACQCTLIHPARDLQILLRAAQDLQGLVSDLLEAEEAYEALQAFRDELESAGYHLDGPILRFRPLCPQGWETAGGPTP